MSMYDFNLAEIPWPAAWFDDIKEVQSEQCLAGLVE